MFPFEKELSQVLTRRFAVVKSFAGPNRSSGCIALWLRLKKRFRYICIDTGTLRA